MIELSTSKMTEVFRVDSLRLREEDLASRLHHYFVEKEEKEIQRIGTLVRFFQLDRCLSHNLARYFDDQQAPEKCGHCSVCRGQVAHLEFSHESSWPSDTELQSNLQGLINHLQGKTGQVPGLETCCRFLAGISVPVFTRNKVRQLSGFASCDQQRYQLIREKVQALGILG